MNLFDEKDVLVNNKTGTKYRVLVIFDGNVFACVMNVSSLDIQYFTKSGLDGQIKDGVYFVEKFDPTIFDPDLFFGTADSEDAKRFFGLKKMCSDLFAEYKYNLQELATRGKSNAIKKQWIEQSGLSRQTLHKYLLRYLQSGLQDTALIDNRKLRTSRSKEYKYTNAPGRRTAQGNASYLLTQEDYKNFDKQLKKYLHSEVKSLRNAYLDLIDEDYSVFYKQPDENGDLVRVRVPLPTGNRPSERQFTYYVSTHTTKQSRMEAKKTPRIVRNNARVFTGTVMKDVRGPGHFVEMDAQEMDIALVSGEYHDIPVGRPILYVMIDVMSEIILGVSLAMDNNSIVGCTNCFLNLVEDKTEIFKKYGVNFDFKKGIAIDDIWPTGYKPRVVAFDNGSDFVSKPIARMLKELNIRPEHVSPATGSLKPLVEGFFHTVKYELDDLLEHKGLIRQTYGSKHHDEACLTFDDAFRIVLNHVIMHNTHVLSNYIKSAGMKEKHVIASPMNLWKYGNEELTPAVKFQSRDDALYHILLPCTDAKISRFGIKWKNLPYFNAEDEDLQNRMFNLGNRSEKFECRYDPRDMGHLYYLKGGRLKAVSLPEDDFRLKSYYGISVKRFDELEKASRDQKKLENEINLQARINVRRANKQVIESAQAKSSGKNKKKNSIRSARKEEKELISGERSVAERFAIDSDSKKSEKIADAGAAPALQEKQIPSAPAVKTDSAESGAADKPKKASGGQNSIPQISPDASPEEKHRWMIEMSLRQAEEDGEI